jgi:hypothetical protein
MSEHCTANACAQHQNATLFETDGATVSHPTDGICEGADQHGLSEDVLYRRPAARSSRASPRAGADRTATDHEAGGADVESWQADASEQVGTPRIGAKAVEARIRLEA